MPLVSKEMLICGKPLEESCPGDETVTKSKGAEVDDEDDNSITIF